MAAHFSHTWTVQLEYTNHLLQFSKLFSYYAGIMLNAFSDLLYSKLCWHNRLVPIYMCVHDDFSTHPYILLDLLISYGVGRVYHKG